MAAGEENPKADERTVIDIRGLSLTFETNDGPVQALSDIEGGATLAGVLGTQVLPQAFAPRPQVLAQAQLDTLDTGTRGGAAELLSSRGPALDLRVQVERLDAGDGYLEVWLINSDLKRMVSIGVLPGEATEQDFRVTRRLIDAGYVIVDISREQFDDRPEHSGDSLLRGSLA